MMSVPKKSEANNQLQLDKYLHKAKVFIEAELSSALAGQNFPKKLDEAMRYSLLAGGKRLRPVLSLASAEVCGGQWGDVAPLAVCLEMIHAFSLIHDDLPAMDDDDLRRGQPTNHKKFGEAVAILAGDGLFSFAFEVLGRGLQKLAPERGLEILVDVARATGPAGMVGGQVLDMSAEGKNISLDDLQNIHRLKTGCLLEVPLTAAAKMVGAGEREIKQLSNYGQAIGLAFQITDDILDVTGGLDLGKDVGSDEARGKSTYPKLLGLAKSRQLAEEQLSLALGALSSFDESANPLRQIAHYIIDRQK